MKATFPFIGGLVLTVACAAPALAQTRRPPVPDDEPAISLRPFFLATGQRFSASQTFDAIFGQSFEPFLGGGIELAFRQGFYLDLAASRFKKTGTRAFLSNGQVFSLGIPLTATETPIEGTIGYRFTLRRAPGVVPYLGGGVGWYHYTETSDFAAAGENVDASHIGYLAVGGVEFRVSRWIRVSGDAQYTRVTGILGSGGISQDTNENDLGGVAARVRVLVGP
jgi:opacity protein-like surface antigen